MPLFGEKGWQPKKKRSGARIGRKYKGTDKNKKRVSVKAANAKLNAKL